MFFRGVAVEADRTPVVRIAVLEEGAIEDGSFDRVAPEGDQVGRRSVGTPTTGVSKIFAVDRDAAGGSVHREDGSLDDRITVIEQRFQHHADDRTESREGLRLSTSELEDHLRPIGEPGHERAFGVRAEGVLDVDGER